MATTFGGNSGYVGYSESVRSYNAKREGRFPKTTFKKEYGISEKMFNTMLEREIIANTEWHHTSKFGNKTKFYGIKDEILFVFLTEGKEAAFEIYKQKKAYKWLPLVQDSKVDRYEYRIQLAKDHPQIEYLKGKLEWGYTKRYNFNFYLRDRKMLEDKTIRDLFKK